MDRTGQKKTHLSKIGDKDDEIARCSFTHRHFAGDHERADEQSNSLKRMSMGGNQTGPKA